MGGLRVVADLQGLRTAPVTDMQRMRLSWEDSDLQSVRGGGASCRAIDWALVAVFCEVEGVGGGAGLWRFYDLFTKPTYTA